MTDDGSKLRSKHRWRGKIFHHDEKVAAAKEQPKHKLNDDVMDFLKPSAAPAPAPVPVPALAPTPPTHTQSPAILTEPTPPRAPRIDVSSAQRWPGASYIGNNDTTPETAPPGAGVRPGLSSLKARSTSGKDSRSLSVTFARAKPEIIGEGGDESEEPAIEVSRRRPAGTTLDDSNLSLQSTGMFGGMRGGIGGSAAAAAAAAGPTPLADHSQRMLQRSKTSHGEMSAKLRARNDGGNNMGYGSSGYMTHDTQDLSFRPGPLRRAPTKFTDDQITQPDDRHNDTVQGRTSEEAPRVAYQSRLRSRMSSEEGKAFHSAFQAADDDSGDDSLRPSSSTSNSDLRPAFSPSQEHLRVHPDRSRMNSTTRRDGSPLPPTPSPGGGSPQRKQLPIREAFPPQEHNGLTPSRQHSIAPMVPRTPSHATPNYPNLRSPDILSISRPPNTRTEQDGYPFPIDQISSNHSTSLRRPSPRNDGPSTFSNSSAGNAALEDFIGRVTHMWAIFRLTCELDGVPSDFTSTQWIRASLWWFLKGRCDLEHILRNRARGPDGRPTSQQGDPKLMQPHVDLAKAWWIVSDIIPTLPAMAQYGAEPNSQMAGARSVGDKAALEVLEASNLIITSLKTLLQSTSRNNLMPPHQSLLQGQDQRIWIKHHRYAPDVQAVLASGATKSLHADAPTRTNNPLKLMPPADSMYEFCYGRFFVHTFISIDGEADEDPLPCVLSMLRGYNEWNLKIAICSQSELLNLSVQGDRKAGPTWEEVKWNQKRKQLQIRLPRGFDLEVQFSEPDFSSLLSLYDHTIKVESSIQPRSDERLAHEVQLAEFQYTVSGASSPFNPEKMQRCRARVFERWLTQHEGGQPRRYHKGFRLVVATSPKHRNLGYVAHDFGHGNLMKYEFRVSPDGSQACAMILSLKEKDRPATALLVFNDKNERNALYSVLNGMTRSSDEIYVVQLPLKALEIAEANMNDASSYPAHRGLRRLTWRDTWVTNREPEDPTADQVKVLMSENLRIVARHDAGSVTDRMNVGKAIFVFLFLL